MGRTSQKQPPEAPVAKQPVGAKATRQRVIGAVTAGVLVTALAVGVVVVATSGDSNSGSTEGAFGTHYDGLEDRRVEAGVSTMNDPAAPGAAHIHPVLSVYAGGEQIPLPTNIGIDPSRPPQEMAGLHTHDSSGVIHVENAADPTLGQFFQIWGVPLSAERLGLYEAEGDQQVSVWVDGQPSDEFGDLVLEDGQEVVVAYGTEAQLPSGLGG